MFFPFYLRDKMQHFFKPPHLFRPAAVFGLCLFLGFCTHSFFHFSHNEKESVKNPKSETQKVNGHAPFLIKPTIIKTSLQSNQNVDIYFGSVKENMKFCETPDLIKSKYVKVDQYDQHSTWAGVHRSSIPNTRHLKFSLLEFLHLL